MLFDSSNPIGCQGQTPPFRSRAETVRLVGIAIASRTAEDRESWSQVAQRIAVLEPDLATLLRFVRREPALLTAYFSDDGRVRLLIEHSKPAERALIAYAHDLARGQAPPLAAITEDELLRVRLYELALIADAPDPLSITAAAEALALRSPSALSALAFLLLRMGRVPSGRLPLQAIVNWPNERRRVFFWRYLAFTFHRRLSPFADPAKTFRLTLSSDEKIRALRLQMPGQFVTAKRTGSPLLCQIVQRAGLSPTQWFDLSLTLPRLSALTTVESWTRLVRGALGSNQAKDYLSRPVTLRAMTSRFGADGVLHLYNHYGVRTLFEQSLENGARSSKRILKNFADRYPQILPVAILQSVEDFTADRDTFITLVSEYLIRRPRGGKGEVAEIVAAAFDTPPAAMRGIIQSETGRRLMAVLTQFKTRHGVNLLRSILFTVGAAPGASEIDGYLYELRNAFNLELALHAAQRGGKSVGKAAQRRLFEKFFLLEFGVDSLPVDCLSAAREHLRARAVSRINAVLEAQGAAQRLDACDLDALARDWRDPEPVVTLLARLSDPTRRGGPSTDAVQLVLQAAKFAAQRNFFVFKFDHVGGQRQLHFLSEAQRAVWRESRALVRVGGAERSDNQLRLGEMTRRLEADLARLCMEIPAELAPLTPELRSEIAELASEEIKANPIAVVARTLSLHVASDQIASSARACLLEIAARVDAAPGAFQLRNAARLMRALVRIGFAAETEACRDVLEDLRAIEREIPRDLLDGEMISKGIVVTAFDCSPRLMLVIGDLVNTGCCLNYHSGSRINVLPAYLVDANIQALVSWHLKQTHFASVRDYKAVLNAFVAGRPPTASFDGDRLVFRFAVSEGLSIDTVSLGFAHLRQIVRLGRVRHLLSSRPGLLAEREYAQPHPLQPLMHANHADILHTLAQELGAVDSRPLKFPKSRNPDGVYCDALGGVQSNEYTVFQ